MAESIYEFVMGELELSKGNWSAVAGATRMSKRTIEKIARREIKDPGVSHIEKLANYFRSRASMKTRSTELRV
jgi:transcriptional regulator with XRE-family HTH domain